MVQHAPPREALIDEAPPPSSQRPLREPTHVRHAEPAPQRSDSQRGEPQALRNLLPLRERQPRELEVPVAVAPRVQAPLEPALDELERVKARLEREAEREVERRERDLLVSFLDVVDDLDRAIASAEAAGDADRALLDGVEMVRDRFLDKLAARGVERSGAVGERFDPAVHNAVAVTPATRPADDGRVTAIVQPGYRIDDTLLRPATVVVGKA